MNESCSNCRYYLRKNGGDSGYCRRFPPILSSTVTYSVFPTVIGSTMWCGEYKTNPAPTEQK